MYAVCIYYCFYYLYLYNNADIYIVITLVVLFVADIIVITIFAVFHSDIRTCTFIYAC